MIEVAKAHTIDAGDPQVIESLNRERVEQLAEKHRLSAEEIKAGKRRGNVICADDYDIADIGIYGDLAEFLYDIRGSQVLFRPLDGWWPESLRNAGEFRLLTAKEVESSRAELPVPG